MLMIAGAYAMLPVLLTIFIPTPATLNPLSIGIAVVAALGCIVWSMRQLRPASVGDDFKRLQTSAIGTLAMAEMVTLSGIFIGSAPHGPYVFTATTEILILTLVVPAILRFFR